MGKDSDIRDSGNESGSGIISEEAKLIVARYITHGIMPRLVEEAASTGDDEGQTDSLKAVQVLIKGQAIGISVVGSFGQKAEGLDKDVALGNYRVSGKKGFALAIVVNPAVAHEITSVDDREAVVGRVKQVMLEAYEAFNELTRKGEFISGSQV